MSNSEQNKQNQKGAPQDMSEMASGGNSPSQSSGSGGSDVERSGGAGAQRAPDAGESTASNVYKNDTGDPGRTPGSAEGVEDFEETGNE